MNRIDIKKIEVYKYSKKRLKIKILSSILQRDERQAQLDWRFFFMHQLGLIKKSFQEAGFNQELPSKKNN